MNKHLIALSLIGALDLSAKASAEEYTEQASSCNSCCCKPCCCEPKPKKCIDCECYTPQFYDLQCDCGFFLDGEFLYWYARETNLSYALKIQAKESTTIPASDGSPPPTTLVFASQSYEHLSTKWDPGFRVGLGFNSDCDGWDYYLHWTYFHNKKSNSTSVSPEYILGSNPFLADKGDSLLINPWINASFHGIGEGIFSFDTINAKWRLSFNSVDLELGRKYWLSKCFNLRPYVGLRGAWTRTTFRTKSLRNISFEREEIGGLGQDALFDEVIDANFKDRFKTRNWGAGILGGIQPTWYFCSNFALFSNLDVALLWGEFENKKREKYQNISTTTQIKPEQGNPITRIDPSYSNLSKNKFFQMNALLDLAIGLRWEEYWCCEQYRSAFDIGWEHHIWFDHNHRNKSSDSFTITPGRGLGAPTVDGFRAYDEVTGNLCYGGLVVRLRFDF